MKRLISTIVALCVLLCCCNVSASVSMFYDIMLTPCYSASAETQMYIQLNRPLTFLNSFDEDEKKYFSPVDIKSLAESALGFDCSLVSTEYIDPVTMKVRGGTEAKVNLPLEINSSLKADVYADTGVWLDVDFADINKPIFDMVLKLPYSVDYIVTDFSDFVKSGANFQPVIDQLKKYYDPSTIHEFNTYVLDLIKKHCIIKETRTSMEYTIFADDAAVKAVFAGIMSKSVELAKEATGEYAEWIFDDSFYEMYNSIGETLNSIPIVGKDGIKVTVRVKGKQVLSTDIDAHICINIYDIMKADGAEVVEFNRDDWYVDFTATCKTSYTKYNEPVEIEFPEVSRENSITLTEVNSSYYYDDEEMTLYTGYDIQPESDGMFMIPMRDCFASLGLGSADYTINGDIIEVVPQDPDDCCAKASLEVGSNKILVNGSEKTMARRVVRNEDGLILVSADAAGYIANATMVNAKVYMDSPYSANSITYVKNEAATAPDLDALIDYDAYVEDDSESDNEDMFELYISSRVWAEHEGQPVVINDTLYLPLVSCMEDYDVEDISYESGVVVISAPNEHPKEFNTIQLAIDSNVVTIDGAEHAMANAVIGKDGSTYVPVEFFELIDCELRSVEYSFYGDVTSFVLYRNQYAHEPYVPTYLFMDIESTEGIVKDDSGYYLPLNNIMGPLKIRAENIVVDDTGATIVAHDPVSGFEKIVIEGTNIDVDGTAYTMKAGLKKVNDVVYVHQSFVENVFDGNITNVSIDYEEEKLSTWFDITIKNPQKK